MNPPTPYVPHRPGDLITAEDWNRLQTLIKQDIYAQIAQAVHDIKRVDQAGDADTLTGKTPAVLEDEVAVRVLEKLAGRTGYRQLFKRLKKDDEKVIAHGLKHCPLVDIYQLDYFLTVTSKDDAKVLQYVNFFLYHTSERKIRFAGPPAVVTVEIESSDSHHHPYRIPFTEMLRRYEVKYTDKTSLEDLVNDFWEKLFSDPNDEFDEDQYSHSPWFERCCREDKSVEDLKESGDLDDIWFTMRPRKTDNYPFPPESTPTPPATLVEIPFPQNVQVVDFDFDTLGMQLLLDPKYPTNPPGMPTNPPPSADVQKALKDAWDPVNKTELKVMVLLKV